MDRKAVLAFVLMFVVFLLWSKLMSSYGPSQQASAPDSTVAAASERAVADAGSAAAPAEAVETSAAAGAPAETPAEDSAGRQAFTAEAGADPRAFVAPAQDPAAVTVATSLYEMVIDPVGARIVGWTSRVYAGSEGGTLQLVPQENQGEGPGDKLVFTGGALDVSRAVFSPLGPSRVEVPDGAGEKRVEFSAMTAGGIEVRKIFTIRPGRYDFMVDYVVTADSSPESATAAAILGDPMTASFAWSEGLTETEAKSGSAFARGQAGFRSFAQVGEEKSFKNRTNLKPGSDKAFGSYSGSVRLAGVQSKYFMIAGVVPGFEDRVVEGDIRLGGNPELMRQSWEIEIPLRGDRGLGSSSLLTYIGPSDYNLLQDYGNGLRGMVNLGWKWIQPISQLVLVLMNWLHKFIPNYGWVIVIISILSKLIFYPLTERGTRSMRNMQVAQARLKPRLDAAKQKYSNDPQKYNQEMMKIYKEEGVNPMAGMAGCLPMLVQMPVFIALYQVLYNMIDLRQAPFIFWIQDLSQPDALFDLPFSLPFLGSHFNLLPIIMAAVTLLQTKMTPTAGSAGQMASINTIMPIMMLFLLYNMPSGLVIYWTINTAVTAYQTWMIHRSAPAPEGA